MAASPLLVLFLPGLDGTGQLFEPLLRELPAELEAQVVQFPLDRALGYEELVPYVEALLPPGRRFAVVAESFSGPLALRIAAKQPPGLVAVVLAASFHRRPIPGWLSALRPMVGAILSRPAPAWAIRHLLVGPEAPAALVAAFREATAAVHRDVLVARVHEALSVDASAALAACRVPLLYLGGSEDRLLRPGITEEFRAIQPNVEIRVLSAPHLILQLRPREAGSFLREFLGRMSSPAVVRPPAVRST